MIDIEDIHPIVEDILNALTFRQKSVIANMNEEHLDYLQYAFDMYISDKAPDDEEKRREITKLLWEVCKKSHKIHSLK